MTFDIPGGLRDFYRFYPGQYVTLRATLDGVEIRRAYSICSAPGDGELRIAVKRVDDGAFSSWANDGLRIGDELDVMTPTGRFGAAPEPDAARIHVGFAGGSGITPILSIARGMLAMEPQSSFFLFYGNRTVADMLFRESLEELKDRFLDRLSVFHILSREQQDIAILNGRLDREKIALLLRSIVPARTIDHAFVCGPTGMSETVEAALAELGVESARVHVERFVSEFEGKPRPRPAAPAPQAIAAGRMVGIVLDGKRNDVPVAAGEAILDAALRAGLDLPYACKGGMCSTCRAKTVEGTTRMDVNFSLEPWEIARGFVLACQAHPTSERVVIDFDQV